MARHLPWILAFLPMLAHSLGDGQIIIGSRVTVEHSAEGEVMAADEPMDEASCKKLAEEKNLVSPVLKTLQQKLETSEINFNKEILGRSIVARELQLCLAEEP